MKRITRLVFGACAGAVLAGCSASGTPGPTINAVNPNFGKLQFAVGTANLYGTTSGLNVVSTLRQPNGHSAYGVDAPTITGPFVLNTAPAPANGSLTDPYNTVVNNGPSLLESGGTPTIGSTPETVHPGTPFCDTTGVVSGFTTCPPGISPNASTFGQSGGAFAMGIAPYNTVAATGQSYSYQPYAQPMYETTGHFPFVDWGGPPAFDPDQDGMGTRDGLIPLDFDSFGNPFFLGVGEGMTIFENVTPSTGTYNMAVVLAILGPNGTQFLTKNAGASMTSTALLPTATTPVVTPDGTGGVTFDITSANFPPGVTEALVQIVDYGPDAGPLHPQGNGGLTAPNCQFSKGTQFAPVYYTLLVTATGSFTLDASHGPNTNDQGKNLKSSPSICTDAQNTAAAGQATDGDNFTVQIIGLDYPGYEAAHSLLGNTVPQAPPIVGANGQADITVSVPQEEDYPTYAPQGLLHVHRPLHPMVRPRVHTAIGKVVGPGM